jgi:Bacterial lipid A biosynthesis acyltransferase
VITKGDFLQTVKIAALAALAWTTPPSLWRKAAAATLRLRPIDRNLLLYRVLEAASGPIELAAFDDLRRNYSREAKLQILGLNGPWRSWSPDVVLQGESNLRKALGNGKGAILWVAESVFGTLILKMALKQANYHACQLSRPTHGFSVSPFGIRFLNPLWIRVEDRFIGERVFIEGQDAARAMPILRDRLAANGVVIISLGPEAKRFVEVPFFRHHIRLPTGPMRLAQSTGAALLPTFSRTVGTGRFEVSIESALELSGGPDAYERIATAFAEHLERYVRANPEQWIGWEGYQDYAPLLVV